MRVSEWMNEGDRVDEGGCQSGWRMVLEWMN